MKRKKYLLCFTHGAPRKKVINNIKNIYMYVKEKAKPTKTKQNNRSTTIKASIISTTETRTISQCHHVFAVCFH